MNPVFNEYINFLKDKGVNIEKYNIREGYFWLDNQIIKAFDKQGNLQKILRLKVDDDLNIIVKDYGEFSFDIESWEETIERNKGKLQNLETGSILTIKNSIEKYKSYKNIILSSGGKDSTLTSYLVKQVVEDIQTIFSNTTLDCADTYLYIKSQTNVKIINPKEGFYQWRKRLEFIPSRFRRSCCDIFKEGAMIKELNKDQKYLFFMGMRNEESNNRSTYEDEWKNHKWEERPWQAILPIRKWTELNVWLYILWKRLDINLKYKKGYSRVGCAIACPYYIKSTWILDKYWYPLQYKRWHDILEEDFIKGFKWTRMNCTLKEYHLNWPGGLIRKEPTEEVIQEFAEAKRLTKNVASKYFNNTCKTCSKKVNTKDVVAMNMKYLGRNTEDYYCKKHLIEFLNKSIYDNTFTNKEWDYNIQRFKDQGCNLF